MTMRRSPRRPLILKRRKLPFQQNELPTAGSQSQSEVSLAEEHSSTPASQCFLDGIRIIDHHSMSDTQVVVIPKTADLQNVIGALTVKGKESGPQGPNKFILLSENGDNATFCHPAALRDGQTMKAEISHNSLEAKPPNRTKLLNKELECGPLDDSLTNIHWLGKMSTCTIEPEPTREESNKENPNTPLQALQNPHMNEEAGQQSERPPYSYMAMIQFAINSRKDRRMTLKEIYLWIEDHFPYFRRVAKPGWKNSIRHNLSLHDMFIRATSPDGKVSFWTIRPEANRCLTLDQVYKQRKKIPEVRKPSTCSEKKMKPLLPRTDSYLVPIQLPVTSSVYLPSSATSLPQPCLQQKRNTSRGAKRVRIAPKVTPNDISLKSRELKKEPECVLTKCETPKAALKRPASSSRRKQRLIHSVHEEPVLLCHNNTFLDSGVASDASTFHDVHDTELDVQQDSPDREFSFKTPIKSSNHLTSSTPSKAPLNALPEPWKVTPVGKGSQNVLDFSPIRTPGGPAVTPRHDYTTFSFSSTPFKDLLLFSSPRELLAAAPSKGTGPADSSIECLRGSCSPELLQAGSTTAVNRSITEGLVLDTLNDSLSKILVDISFTGLDDEDLGIANISWSEFIPQLK
ncbi:forkhead box protein M1 isoform X2 [Betta splendens]|uniref:Forkhead box protein M1 n=1 Tax=Betta splendens TaxID=158456 RepID=A0A6P7NRC1_BETSP|nr:forkhead box protein M1 isoform X2 [Betta splendens]